MFILYNWWRKITEKTRHCEKYNVSPNTLPTFLKNKVDILKEYADNNYDSKISKSVEYSSVAICLFK
jgi:hypothetical protein